MPLHLVDMGQIYTVQRVGGSGRLRHYLEGMGFTAGAQVMVVSEFAGNLIVLIKHAKIAVAKDVAKRIICMKESTDEC